MSDIIVYGRGKTGQALGKIVQKEGFEPVFYDDELGFAKDKEFQKGDVVLLSPGVKPSAAGVVSAKKAGCSLVGELDYCFPMCKAKCVSVTGTNGKTTICELIYHVLKFANKQSRLLGNGGVPFSSQVAEASKNEVVVLESSSFQLATAQNFSPYISVLSNVAPDHVDYHGTFESYVRAKMNNFLHQSAKAYSVFNADDEVAVQLSDSSPSLTLYYSVSKQSNCFYHDECVCLNVFDKTKNFKCPFFKTLAKHNLSNVLCAILVCAILGVDAAECCSAIKSFNFLPHRLQVVGTYNGVTFVDDSKATNVHATVSALQCYENIPLALIMGGSDKNCTFDDIFKNIRSNVRLICAVGDTAEKIRLTGRKYLVDVKVCANYKLATMACYTRLKNIGGVVLMSNACASFDLFDGYAARGDFFAKAVEDLIRAEKS